MLLRFSKISFFLVLLFIGSCGPKTPEFEIVELDPKVVLSFELVNGSEPVDIGSFFTDSESWGIELKTLKFYASDIRLVTSSGAIEKLADVELIDFDDQKNGHANKFKQQYSYIIPKGDYSQFKMSIGLPSQLNSSDPTTFPNDDPLGTQSGMYWDWGSMYVFIMMGAGVDTNADAVSDGNIAFHTGLDTLFRPERNYPMTFEIPAYTKDTLHVKIHWNRLFNVSGEGHIDLGTIPFFHANTDATALNMTRKFTDNFVKSIEVSQ